MTRLLAVFNVVAGGASIAGLLVTLFSGYQSWILSLLFAFTALLAAYVLFIPGNRIELNVASKIAHYQNPHGHGRITKVQGEFDVVGVTRLREIPFPRPFEFAPEVELVRIEDYHGGVEFVVKEVTPHKLVVFRIGKSPELLVSSKYRWIATGTLLSEVKDDAVKPSK